MKDSSDLNDSSVPEILPPLDLHDAPSISMLVVEGEEEAKLLSQMRVKPDDRQRIYRSLATALGEIQTLVTSAQGNLSVEDYGDALRSASQKLILCAGCVEGLCRNDEARMTNDEALKAKREISSWQPIKTAPRDGTRIDLWMPRGHRRPDCFWGRPEHSCGESGEFCDSCPDHDGWVDGNDFMGGYTDERPSHWMPRPSAPEAAKLKPLCDNCGRPATCAGTHVDAGPVYSCASCAETQGRDKELLNIRPLPKTGGPGAA